MQRFLALDETIKLASALYEQMSEVTTLEISKFPDERKDGFNDLFDVLEQFLKV